MKNKILMLAVFLGALAQSCINDDTGAQLTGNGDLTLTYDVSGPSGTGVTRDIETKASVAYESGEDNVQSLYLMFFEPAADKSGHFIEYIEMPASGGLVAGNTSFGLPVGSALSVTGAYNVLAIANLDRGSYLGSTALSTWFAQWEGKTEAEVMSGALAYSTGNSDEGDYTAAGIAPGAILMSGRTSKAAGSGNISVTLTRNVSRFDVIGVPTGYTLMSASVWNAYPLSSVFGGGDMDYTAGQPRLHRFYGTTPASGSNEIKGRLYAFENQSAASAAADGLTTCLVIGLNDGGATSYYRVNINPEESAQALKRNNVYQVTVTGVYASGAGSEKNAWENGTDGSISYVINYWDLAESGIIVQDGASILAMPTNAVNIGKDGGTFGYSIYTFTSASSAGILSIKGVTGDVTTGSGNITASLTGNILTVTATALTTAGEERAGTITLTFMGLQATVSVVQSESVEIFLTVVQPAGGIPDYAAVAGGSSGQIEVKASGPWSAELIGDGGFSFNSGSTVTKVAYDDVPDVTSERYFEVHAITNNTDKEPREAYIIVSLDTDPVNYAKIIALKQSAAGSVNISPASVTFDWAGNVQGTVSAQSKVMVTITNSSGEIVNNWTCSGQSRFTVASHTGSTVADNYLIITALQNLTENTYSETLTITGSGATAELTVKQMPLTFTLATPDNINTPVSNDGGQTGEIALTTPATGLQWKASIATSSNTVSGYSLVNHNAWLTDASGMEIPLSGGYTTPQSTTTTFKVTLPKVYFPNREITGIRAVVTVELYQADGVTTTGLTRTLTVNQEALTSQGAKIWNAKYNSTSNPYGNLASVYIRGYANALNALGYSWTNGSNSNSAASPCPAGTTYAHFANLGINSSYSWASIETFRTGTDGILVMCVPANDISAINNSSSPMGKFGYNIVYGGGSSSSNGARLVTGIANSRIGEFLTTYGAAAISDPSSVGGFYTDGIHTSATTISTTAVPIMVQSDGGTNNGNTIMAVDPANNLVYLGESQLFYNDTYLSGSRRTFMNNFIEYVINAAKYGSHFTDLLREDAGRPKDKGGSDLPSPWDTVWGANAWKVRSN